MSTTYRYINWQNKGKVTRRRVRATVWTFKGMEFFFHKRNNKTIVSHSRTGRMVLATDGNHDHAMTQAKMVISNNLAYIKNFSDQYCPAN